MIGKKTISFSLIEYGGNYACNGIIVYWKKEMFVPYYLLSILYGSEVNKSLT